MLRFKVRWLVFAAALAFLASEQAWAQRGRQPQPKGPQGKPISKHGPVKGTVEMSQGGMLKVVGTPGVPAETWIVAAEPGATIKITGTAEASYLKPGHNIRFNGMVEKKSIVKDPVSKLTLFTQLAAPAAGPGGPIGKPAGGGLNELGGAAAKLAETEASPMSISGKITAVKGNKITMNVPGVSPKLQVELADNAAIDVDMSDLSVVRPGDTVEITGGQDFGGRVMAKEMEVKLTQPLGAATAKKKPASAPAKPEGKPGKKAGGFPFGENK